MNISARCEYACRALVELARVQHIAEPLASQVIAERRQVPEKYLVHILLQLKRAGLVQSVRGAQGGYRLARPAEEISLLEIVEAIDGPVMDPLPVEDAQTEELRMLWQELGQEISRQLRGRTLKEIASGASQSNMYYI